MVVYFFIISCFLPCYYSVDIISLLLGEENLSARREMEKFNISAKQQNTFVRRLSQLPFTKELKSEAWYKLIKYRSASNFHVSDWENYESLIPYIPPDILQTVNFSDDYIVRFFGKQHLEQNQLSVVAETVFEMEEDKILDDEDRILKLGNIICGFSSKNLEKINRATLRGLLSKEFFNKISGCSMDQLKVLKHSMLSYTLIGPPNTWKPETVKLAGSLVAALDSSDIRLIRERSFVSVTPEIIDMTPRNVLKDLRMEQIRVLSRDALLAWRRKTLDMRPLYGGLSSNYRFPKILVVFILGLIL